MQAAIDKEKRYPRKAFDTHSEGVVTVAFEYTTGNKAQNISLLESSGNEYLDQMTLLIVARATLPPKPCEFMAITNFTISENYELSR
jgi:TonB family protein